MARADHKPNCSCERCSAEPIGGNINSATEFRMNTVPIETAISSSLACTMGATAAMALPPQIAVPAVIKNAAVFSTLKSLPTSRPAIIAKVMLPAVETKPLRPARSTSCRFIPKPSATTEALSRNLASSPLSAGEGCAKVSPNTRPTTSATGGERNPLAAQIKPTKKRVFGFIFPRKRTLPGVRLVAQNRRSAQQNIRDRIVEDRRQDGRRVEDAICRRGFHI